MVAPFIIEKRDIELPAVGSNVLLSATGQTTVRVIVDNTANYSVYAIVKNATEGHTWPDTLADGATPEGATLIPVKQVMGDDGPQDSPTIFEKTDFPVTVDPPVEPTVNNKRVFVAYYMPKMGARTRVDRESRPFKAWTAILGEVSAKHCLWLTYATPGHRVIGGETTNPADGFLPASFRVPLGATQVKIEVVAGFWRHDPDSRYASGPDGLVSTTKTMFADEYKKGDLKSDQIVDVDDTSPLPHNRLVYLWQYPNPATRTQISDARANGGVINFSALSPQPTHLRLGCHDSHNWANNSGAVQVRVTWS